METQIELTPYEKTIIIMPVLRKVEFNVKELFVISSEFLAPFYKHKCEGYAGDDLLCVHEIHGIL